MTTPGSLTETGVTTYSLTSYIDTTTQENTPSSPAISKGESSMKDQKTVDDMRYSYVQVDFQFFSFEQWLDISHEYLQHTDKNVAWTTSTSDLFSVSPNYLSEHILVSSILPYNNKFILNTVF